MNKAILTQALFIEANRRIKRKGLALRVAFGCAVRVFLKVYRTSGQFHAMKGDKISVAYTLEIK